MLSSASTSKAQSLSRVHISLWARKAIAVAGMTLITALAAQIRVPLPGTPVPMTLQTLAVLMSVCLLGAKLGSASMALYLLLGAVGLPIYASHEGGLSVALGASGGYLIGFVICQALAGAFVTQRQQLTRGRSLLAVLVGTMIIYTCGLIWLWAGFTGSLAGAVELGLVPFIFGAVMKVLLAMELSCWFSPVINRFLGQKPRL